MPSFFPPFKKKPDVIVPFKIAVPDVYKISVFVFSQLLFDQYSQVGVKPVKLSSEGPGSDHQK